MLLTPTSFHSRLPRRKVRGIVGASLVLPGSGGCSPANDSPGAARNQEDAPLSLKGKRIGIASPHKVEILNELYSDMRREAERSAPDVKVIVVDGENDAMKQLEHIEAFIAQRYDAIFFLAPPSAGLDDLVARGVAAGVVMVSHGASPATGATQNIVLDQHESGRQVGLFAANWINERYGGEAEVGILGNSADPSLELRTLGMKDGLAEAAPATRVVAEVHGHSIESGSKGAANMLQSHPKICALLAHADDPGFGCYTAATEAGRRDPDRFLVVSCDGTRLVLERIAENGIYQATWSYLFPYSATAAMLDILRAMRGERVPPTRHQVGRLVTRASLPEIQAMSVNPRAVENQKYFLDPTVMSYSDTPLMSHES